VAPASAVLEDALRVAREQEALTWEPLVSISLARLWIERGEQTVVADLLAPVYARFTEGFFTPDLRDAKALPDGTRQTR
jgi:predicted ATPase